MTPCARCNDPACAVITTMAGDIPVCSYCREQVWSLETNQPIETFLGEVGNG